MNDDRGDQLEGFSQSMKADWDERAREDAKWFINCLKRNQSDDEFEASGRPEVEKFILSDPLFIGGRDLKQLRLLEIGCGIGRMTRHLSRIFGEVYGVDVSAEMIAQGKERLADCANVHLYETSGVDFAPLADDYFDRAFSVYVFQHVPDAEVIRANIRDACRVLRPGGIFKFQTCGIVSEAYAGTPKNTWTGASFSESDIRRAARENGMRLVSIYGLGTQYCWAVMRKPAAESALRAASAPERVLQGAPQIVFYGRCEEPALRSIPARCEEAALGLIVSGLPAEECDANDVIVEMNGSERLPLYVGPVSDAFIAAMPEGAGDESLLQVDCRIPEELAGREAIVRLRREGGEWSEPVAIEVVALPREAPRIHLVTNAADGGVDIQARGAKSRIRVFADGLDEGADVCERVRVLAGEQSIEPQSIEFIPANGLYLVIAQLPEAITAGEIELRLRFDDLISEGVKIGITECADKM